MSKLMIISSDGHAALPMPAYRPYVDPEYRAAFDETADAPEQIDFSLLLDPAVYRSYRERIHDSGVIEGRHDPDLRVAQLAREGIVGELIFPDSAPFGAGGLGSARHNHGAELERAGARAYNRWIVEFCADHPGLGIQTIASIYDVDEAVRDVYWAKEHGAKSIFMPGMDADRPLYWDPVYEPFWAACAEVRIPINFHGGTGAPNYRAHASEVPYCVRTRLAGFEFPFWGHRPLWFLIWSGVLERHPNLRLAFTEQHSDWVAEAVAKMDHSYFHGMYDDEIKKIVPMPPSEYFRRQVWIGSSLLARGELISRNQIGLDKMMFGADYPHAEGTIGLTRKYLRATVGAVDMAESEIRAFLGGTAAEFYGFDIDRLAPMAEAHGLELSEVREPLPVQEESMFRGMDVLRPTTSLTRLESRNEIVGIDQR